MTARAHGMLTSSHGVPGAQIEEMTHSFAASEIEPLREELARLRERLNLLHSQLTTPGKHTARAIDDMRRVQRASKEAEQRLQAKVGELRDATSAMRREQRAELVELQVAMRTQAKGKGG